MATATVTKLKNFIDGEFVDPAEGQTEEVLNPATGEAIAEAPLSTAEDVDRGVAAARRGRRSSRTRSRSWSTTCGFSPEPRVASRAALRASTPRAIRRSSVAS